jgi:hypothetical protein
MTKFDKSKFTFHGGYLEYTGTYEGQPTWDQVVPNCHPSRVGEPQELFIGRFKYSGPYTKAKFVKELIKSFTVEEYVEARKIEGSDGSPLMILMNNNPNWAEKIMFDWKKKLSNA